LDEANDCSAGVALRSFVIFAIDSLNVAAADYASADAFEEAVVRTTPNGFVVVWWLGGVLVFVRVELAAAEWPRKRTYDREHGRWPVLSRLNFINGPRQNWNTKATGSRSSTQHLSYALPPSVLDSHGRDGTYCLRRGALCLAVET
jgi:hypothetical protein